MEKSQLEFLDFQVKSIETFLSIPFQGKTIADKQVFASRHWKERVKVTDELLSDAYEEYVRHNSGSRLTND